ncbi:MAG: sulfatase family protein [Pirellulales bacterium]
MNVICLVVDGLRAAALGAYGNTWIATPHLDRLAAEAFLFDQAVIESPRLEDFCRASWQGLHPLVPQEESESLDPTLPQILAAAGIRPVLLTDERAVASHAAARGFSDIVRVEPAGEARIADTIDETHLARFFAAATDWLTTAHKPFLLWLHTRGMAEPWDAPLEFRNQYADEEDPEPPDLAEVPSEFLPEDHDPDELLGIAQAYAGQVSLVDLCVGGLLDWLTESPLASDTLLVLVSPRGFPLGEHGRVGPCDEALYGELVHVPFLLRFPDGMAAACRSQALVEPADLGSTLLDWLGLSASPFSGWGKSLLPIARDECETVRDHLCIAGGPHEVAIRTPAWFLRDAGWRLPDHGGQPPELFLKPDDRFEVNEVSDRCPGVADGLIQAIHGFVHAARANHPARIAPLDESLVTGLE